MKQKNTGLILGIVAVFVVAAVVLIVLLTRPVPENHEAMTGGQPSAAAASASAASAAAAQTASGPPADEAQTSSEASDGSVGQEQFAGSLIVTDDSLPSEEIKLGQINFSSRVFSPVYNPSISLTAESGLDSSEETGAPWTSVLTPDGAQTKTFGLYFNENIPAATAKIVWQVSLYPFGGGPASASDKPASLLLSGEAAKGAVSFSVDFSKVYAADRAFFQPPATLSLTTSVSPALQQLPLTTLGRNALAALGQQKTVPLRTYYVRAFPVDNTGNSIGDCGMGLPVLYGDPLPQAATGNLLQTISMKFSLMPARRSGEVTHGKEFPNDFADLSEVTMYNTGDKSYSVLPSGFPSGTEELLIQVSLSEFGTSSKDWNDVPGLVYEKSVPAGDPVFKALGNANTYGIDIDFSGFAPTDNALPDKQYVRYYVRAVALAAGTVPGTATASYSETVIINYGKYQTPDGFKFYSEIKIDPMIPAVESMSFTPVHWEASGWQYHYVVTRQPTEKEVFMGWGGDSPYAAYPVGTKIDFTPHPEDKSWWEEAWDAISDFFGSITDFAAKLVNWVSNAYADMKSGIINIAVSALPDSWQGPMRTALTALADYGLASMGIPPTLPNFDELASMGTDYLATVAMEQAGIPADSLLEYGVEELSGDIKTELTKSASPASPNPLSWDFVKLDPDYLYKPAYLTLELYNPYDEPTPAGKLSFTAEKFMDMSQNGFDPAITRLYALYGSSYVCLFKPVYGMEIPSLAPGQHLTVPIILEPYEGIPLPGCSAPVSTEGFQLMYGLGKYDFNLRIAYDLPSVSVEAKKQGHTEEAIYSYSTTGTFYSFSHDPYDSISK